ncbi:MAG: tRNA (N(6)-L-threonylcarbamoyladenosine(37)-C(2))-methylthiotransferase MtaB [Bacteriovoracaceae bacterium]|nr:tRNA (N(6)-L-threonylcarbamoyladenosine(37)-C(2))-methylthiotransferase MtaB [Bacteriovoracaceae bacterium]
MEKSQENSKKKVAVHTLGCRLNFSETGSIAQGFVDRGYEVVDFGNSADVVFINTCTVTDKADSTCRNLIRKAHNSSPEGKIVVAGCYSQMEPEAISGMQGVDLVLGTTEKYKVFEYLNEEEENKVFVDKTHEFYGAASTPSEGHTRAFLKIQDGCNYVCSFCIIPFARGRSRAISIADAVEEGKKLIENGFKEIILTGVNIGEYENNSGEKLSELVRQLLDLEGLERLRLSSVEPNTITDELLEVMKSSPKFLDHFHIPLQSGDDQILSEMRRKYSISEYKKVINKIISAFPEAGIGADIICGFPGETEEQFQNTYKLLKELPITHFHVFPYSKRKGTTAAKLDNHIHHDVKKHRVKSLMMFGDAKLSMFAEDQVGRTSEVLFERRNKEGLWEGYTTNFVRVELDSKENLKNQVRTVHLTSARNGRLQAEFIH